jgi:hypothetical protein
MPDGLYDQDILAGSCRQADLLRRLGRGEWVNDLNSRYDEILKPAQGTPPVPRANPFTLQDLLGAPVDQLVERLTRP